NQYRRYRGQDSRPGPDRAAAPVTRRDYPEPGPDQPYRATCPRGGGISLRGTGAGGQGRPGIGSNCQLGSVRPAKRTSGGRKAPGTGEKSVCAGKATVGGKDLGGTGLSASTAGLA